MSTVTVNGEQVSFHHPSGDPAGAGFLAQVVHALVDLVAATSRIEDLDDTADNPNSRMLLAEALGSSHFADCDFDVEFNDESVTVAVTTGGDRFAWRIQPEYPGDAREG